MSDAYDKLYTAKIAACTANDREAIRNGIDVNDEGQRWKESIREGSLITPAHKTLPVLLSHDNKKPVGEIQRVFSEDGWWWADFTLDPSKTFSCVAADNLRVGSPVSVGYRTLRHDESLAKAGVKWHTSAILDEVSVLNHGEHPAYSGAEIAFILPHKRVPRTAKSPPATATPEPRKPARTQIIHRAAVVQPDPDIEELHRRIDWAERRTGRPADVETILTNLRVELGYENDPLRGRFASKTT
jgi:phage head maturation protease